MPKINKIFKRYSNSINESGDNRHRAIKSGVLGKSIKKSLQENELLKEKLPTEFFFSGDAEINPIELLGTYFNSLSFPQFSSKKTFNKSHYFDDSKTIVYNKSTINPVLGITSSFASNLNIISSENYFLTGSNFEINEKVSKEAIGYYRINQNVFVEKYTSFSDSESKSENSQEILIDLPFEEDLILDNLKDTNYVFSSGEFFPKYNSFEKNICYYNFNSFSWDYKFVTDLTLTDTNYFGVNFIPPVVPHTMASSSSIGSPTSTFGFPFSSQQRGGFNNYISLENYITKPFVLEKIKIKLTLTSRGEKSGATADANWLNSNNVDLANTLNFYLLKGIRSHVNTEVLDTNKFSTHNLINIDQTPQSSFISLDLANPTNPKNKVAVSLIKSNPLYEGGVTITTDFNNSGYLDKYFSYTKEYLDTPPGFSQESDPKSTSELISYANLLVYNNHNGNLANIDWKNSVEDIDKTIKIDTGPNPLNSHINFTSSSILIEADCRMPKSYINGSAIHMKRFGRPSSGNDNIVFCSNERGGRGGIGRLSGREYIGSGLPGKAKVLKTETVYTDPNSGDEAIFNHVNKTSEYSPYVLMPKDQILFGIHSFSNVAEFPALFKLHDKISITLVGRYERSDDKNITRSNNIGLNTNYIKTTIIGNTEPVNQYDTDPIQYLSGSYLDNIFEGDFLSQEGRTIKRSMSSGLDGSFTRTISLVDTESVVYDSLMPSILDIWKKNNRTIWSDHRNRNLLYGVDARFYDDTAPLSSNFMATDLFNEWGSLRSWKYDFPFDEKYLDLKRYKSIEYNRSSKNQVWELISDNTELSALRLTFPNQNGSYPPIFDFNPDYNLFYTDKGKGGKGQMFTSVGDYAVSGSDSKGLNKLAFSSILAKDWPENNYYVNSLNMNIRDYYKINPPIAGFKYGVYNPNPVTAKKNFSWKKFGQFIDLYNGTTNLAVLQKDIISYTVLKEFKDKKKRTTISSTDSSITNTYNKDKHCRYARPFFE